MTRVGDVRVIVGPVALRVGRYWVGVASGDKFCRQRRRTAERALRDAAKMEAAIAAGKGDM